MTGNTFDDLNLLTENLNLQTSDIIRSNGPTRFDAYEVNPSNPDASGWFGTISANGGLTANQMYKIRLSEAQSFYTTGSRVDPASWTFEINQNWNWLPYILNARVPINEALARFDARNGDLIKSQSLFAIYDGSNGWIGTLKSLNSGEGYMLRASIAQTFSYPSYFSSKGTRENQEKTVQRDTTFSKYPENMNVIAEVSDGYDTVRFFRGDGTLVGEANTEYIEGKNIAFITVFGDESESLKIAIGCDEDFKIVRNTIEFVSDTLLGSLDEPLKIDELELIEKTFTAYPNPVSEFVQVSFESKVSTYSELILYNLQMQRMFNKQFDVIEGENLIRIPMSSQIQGSYILHLKVGDRTFSKVIIKN